MASIRDIRDKARAALHRAMQVPALYIEGGADPVPCTVRIHKTYGAQGGVKGTSFAYAERQDMAPRVIFLVSEIPAPKNKAIVSIEPGEAYRLDNVLVKDGLTVSVEALQMTAAATAVLPYPGLVYGPSAAVLTLTGDATGEV